MFFEFLQAVVTLDLNWLAWLVFNNLQWVFAYCTISFFFFGPSPKKVAVGFFLISVLMWAWADFESLSAWGIFVAGFLILYYISKIAIMAFAEEVPQLRKHLVAISTIQAISLMVVFNLFIA